MFSSLFFFLQIETMLCIRVYIYGTQVTDCEAVAERLRHRSYEQKIPSSIPRLGIIVEVTSQC